MRLRGQVADCNLEIKVSLLHFCRAVPLQFTECSKDLFVRKGRGSEAEVHTNTCNAPSKMSFAALCPATKALTRLIASPVTSFFLIVAGGALPAAAAATASAASADAELTR